MKRTALITLAFAAFTAAPALAQLTADPTLPTTRIGTRGATFLDLGVGARAQAMGGAYTALADGVDALYWNSAGIADLDGFATAFTQASLYGDLDIDHMFFGAVLPVGLNRFGLSVNVLSSGDMAFTSPEFPNPPPYGPDANPTEGTFDWTGMAVGAHFARPVTDRLVFGGAAKFITEGISGAEAQFFAVDLGTKFETGLYGLTLGGSLLNLGSSGTMEGRRLTNRVNTGGSEAQIGDFVRLIDLQNDTREVELPTVFRFSLMADLIGSASSIISPNPDQNLRLVWDLSDAVNTDLQTSVGAEYSFRDIAFLRVGKHWSNEAQISYDFSRNASIGGGVALPVAQIANLRLDYAYTGMGDLENVQVFSIQAAF